MSDVDAHDSDAIKTGVFSFMKGRGIFLLAAFLSAGIVLFSLSTMEGVEVLTGNVTREGDQVESKAVVQQPDADTSMQISDQIGNLTIPIHALVQQADSALMDADFERALSLYKEAVSKGADVSVLRKIFDVALLTGDKQEAESVLAILSFQGLSKDALDVLRGFLHLRLGKRSKARELFSQQSHQPEYAFGLTIVSILDREDEKARQLLTNVLKSKDPALLQSARTLQGAYNEAELFEDVQNTHLRTLLASALIKINHCPEAITLLKSVVADDGDYRDAWISLFYCQYVLGQDESALASIQRAYALDPERAETQYFLGLAFERIGDKEQARTFLAFAIENGLQSAVVTERGVREHIANLSIESGAYEDAIFQYEAIIVNDDSSEDLFPVYKSLIDLFITYHDDSKSAYDTALRAQKNLGVNSEVLDLLGWTALVSGKLMESERYLEGALKDDPSLASAWYHQCLLQRERDDLPGALKSCKEAHRLAIEQVDADLIFTAADQYNDIVEELP